jgi:hypothetical protein
MSLGCRAVWSYAFGVLVVGVSVWALGFRERALAFQVIHGKVGEGRYIASEEPDTSVRFSDHSELAFDQGARVRVSNLEVHGAPVLLESGKVHVHIEHRPNASWAIDAGPYVVHVTGTEFDLEWKVGEQTLDLRLRRGSVTVNGPLAEEGIHVVAGEHLRMNAANGSLWIADEHGTEGADPESATAAGGARPGRGEIAEPAAAPAPEETHGGTPMAAGVEPALDGEDRRGRLRDRGRERTAARPRSNAGRELDRRALVTRGCRAVHATSGRRSTRICHRANPFPRGTGGA